MRFEIVNAIAVKPDLIRFSVEVFDDEELASEYDLVLHTNDFTVMNAKGGIVEMQINLSDLQQRITEAASNMTVTAGVAYAINKTGLKWEVIEGGIQDNNIGSESDPSQNNNNS